MKNSPWKPALCFILLAALAGCGQTTELQASRASEGGQDSGPSLAQFSDIPIPSGASMNVGRSLIFGPRDGWIGRLVFTTSDGPQQTFEFYARQMPGFGWQEITRVRAEVSVLSYTRSGRAATIQIAGTTLGGSEVNFTVSPQAQGAIGGGAVQSTPLR